MTTPQEQRELSLQEEAKAGLQSLVPQTSIAFLAFVTLLLFTGGNPPALALGITVSLTTTVIAWSEQRRILQLRGVELNSIQNTPLVYQHFRTQASASIGVIGDRASGKTVYLASLFSGKDAYPYKHLKVLPFNDYGEDLAQETIQIQQGLQLSPTRLTTRGSPAYGIEITLEDRGWLSKQFSLITNIKDYAGEFFNSLTHQPDQLLKDYILDCAVSGNIMFLVDGASYCQDRQYSNNLNQLLSPIQTYRRAHGLSKLRIALVLTKCEVPELSQALKDPRQYTYSYFPSIYNLLNMWQEKESIVVDYFASSAFGMQGKTLIPNSEYRWLDFGVIWGVLKDPKQWKPIGLVDPIYWLCTGKRHRKPELI